MEQTDKKFQKYLRVLNGVIEHVCELETRKAYKDPWFGERNRHIRELNKKIEQVYGKVFKVKETDPYADLIGEIPRPIVGEVSQSIIEQINQLNGHGC